MNPVVWIRELPRHMSEALGGVRYMLTFQGLRRLSLFALLGLTVVSTSLGLTDLIAASEAGEVGPMEMAVVGALATVAIISMWIALEFVIRLQPWWRKIVPLAVYLLLVLWSIGFGFGFYWKHLASVGVAQDQTKEMIARVNGTLNSAADSLTKIQTQLNSVISTTAERAAIEDEVGGACGFASGKGQGPYWILRQQISQEVGGLVRDMDVWIGGPPIVLSGNVTPQRSQDPAASGLPITTPSPSASGAPTPGVASTPTPTPSPKATAAPSRTASQPSTAIGGFKTREDALAVLGQGSLTQRIDTLRALAAFEEKAFAGGAKDPQEMRSRLLTLGEEAGEIIGQTNTIIANKESYVRELRRLSAKLDGQHEETYSQGSVICIDSGLAGTLGRAAQALDQLQPIDAKLADLDPQLGPRATQHAFQRLWKNVFFFMPGAAWTVEDRLGGPDLQALVAAIVVDICIFFLTVFGRGQNPVSSIIQLVQRPLPGRELRRRLFSFINSSGDEFRAVFDSSSALFRGQYYLVASEDIPALYRSIRNLQILLRAAGEGEVVDLTRDDETAVEDRTALLDAVRRTLVTAAQLADPDGAAAVRANGFAPSRMAVLRIGPELMFALQALLARTDHPMGGSFHPDQRARPVPDGG